MNTQTKKNNGDIFYKIKSRLVKEVSHRSQFYTDNVIIHFLKANTED